MPLPFRTPPPQLGVGFVRVPPAWVTEGAMAWLPSRVEFSLGLPCVFVNHFTPWFGGGGGSPVLMCKNIKMALGFNI